ncbi:MAG: sugar transferase [Verrucomicrobiales bacterium]
MQGSRQKIQIRLLQVVDGLLVLLAFWASRVIRDYLGAQGYLPFNGTLGADLADIAWILAIVVPLSPLVLQRYGFYDYPLEKRRWDSLRQMFQTMLVLTVLVAMGVVFARFAPSSRLTLAGAVPLGVTFLLLRERATRWYLRRYLLAEGKLETVIFAGNLDDIAAMKNKLSPGVLSAWRVVEVFDLQLRDLGELPDILHQHNVGRVIFAAGHTSFDKVQEAVQTCEVEGVESWIYANFLKTSVARPTFDFLGNQPMLVFRTTPEVSWSMLGKEVFDRTAAFVALVIFAIPMLVIAGLIKCMSPGPAIFKQARSGRHGKPFTMLKFRSMHNNAEQQLAEIKAMTGNEMSGPVFKLEKDPRVFPFGRWLRKLSLDELPQFINVLMGDMSIVGPRPLPTYEVDEFTDFSHRRRLSVKPGLTCLWQVSGRNSITRFEDWIKLDLEYIDNWSLGLDFLILLKTIPVVLLGKGAK